MSSKNQLNLKSSKAGPDYRDDVDIYKLLTLIPSLDIRQANKGGYVHVINTCPTDDKSILSRIMISVPDGQGGEEMIEIQDTWLPQDLSTQMDAEKMLKAQRFRSALAIQPKTGRKPLIKLISEEDASYIMNRPEAAREQKRLDRRRDEQQKAKAVSPTTAVGKENEIEDSKPKKAKKSISNSIMTMIAQVANKQMSTKEMLATLKARAVKVNKAELGYLLAEGPSQNIKQWAATKLGKSGDEG